MRSSVFVSGILLIASIMTWVFFHFRWHFSGLEFYKEKAVQLRSNVETIKLQNLLVKYQYEELRQTYAEVLPTIKFKDKNKESGFAYRNLASVVTHSDRELLFDRSAEELFDRGKNHFKEKNFREAKLAFENLIRDFPTSVFVIKSYFLMIESHYQMNEFEQVAATVDQMVTLFPENELTGFALIRLGQVYEGEDRPEDAVDVYDLVLKTYKDANLRKQAMLQKQRSN